MLTNNIFSSDPARIRLETSRTKNIVNFTCSADGVSAFYTLEGKFFHTWYYKRVRELSGKRVAHSKVVYTIVNYTYQDEGVYDCAILHKIRGEKYPLREETSALFFIESKYI